jgi:hypothetical protein
MACSLKISATVVTNAIAMPSCRKHYRRAVAGDDRPFSAWMKHTDAIRYSIVTRFMEMLMPAPLVAAFGSFS